jgi:toxin CcdB
MAQFDVYAGVGRTKGYVVELQSDLLERLAVRVVAPMVPGDKAIIISGLTPLIRFLEADYLLLTYQLASIPVRELQRPVGSLSADQDAIKRALDLLFVGF